MKKEEFGELTWRRVSPLGKIPRKHIRKFLGKDPEVIAVIKKWIEKNGLTILFTQGKAKGWEKIWVSDEGDIYMNDEDHDPTSEELDVRIKRVAFVELEPLREDLLGKDVSLVDKLKYLKDNERPL